MYKRKELDQCKNNINLLAEVLSCLTQLKTLKKNLLI
jgi:hypothetical protein